MKFCSNCGAAVALKIPAGDTLPRHVCDACGTIHYQNPKMVIGSIPAWDLAGETKVLLCRRAIEPRHGYWTLPAGFMELAETISEGAARETQEEAGVGIDLGMLYTVIDIPQVDQVHVYFLAKATGPELDPGPETLEARWYGLDEIPWDNLAFKSVSTTLKHYIRDLGTGDFKTHHYSLSNPHRP